MPMVPAMQVLAIYGLFRALGATTGAVWRAVGKPQIGTKFMLFQLTLLAILIYPLTMHWGILGTSIAVTAYALMNFIALYIVLNIVKSKYGKPAKILILPLIAALAMIFAIFAIKTCIFVSVTLVSFLVLIAMGIIIYFLVTHLFDIMFDYGIKILIQEQLTLLLKHEEDK